MSAFSDIHHQTWMAFHRAMLSDVPMSVLHPGYPAPSPHVGDRERGDDKGLSSRALALMEAAIREEQQYYEANPEQWEEEDIADEWPIDVWAY